MRFTPQQLMRIRHFLVVLVAFATIQAGLPVLVMGRQTEGSQALMKVLPRFSAPDVPALSKDETETPPLAPGAPPPNDLPGSGIAQHPMLYIGEGYNKILLVNAGKAIVLMSSLQCFLLTYRKDFDE